jgi:hypothetical protein
MHDTVSRDVSHRPALRRDACLTRRIRGSVIRSRERSKMGKSKRACEHGPECPYQARVLHVQVYRLCLTADELCPGSGKACPAPDGVPPRWKGGRSQGQGAKVSRCWSEARLRWAEAGRGGRQASEQSATAAGPQEGGCRCRCRSCSAVHASVPKNNWRRRQEAAGARQDRRHRPNRRMRCLLLV